MPFRRMLVALFCVGILFAEEDPLEAPTELKVFAQKAAARETAHRLKLQALVNAIHKPVSEGGMGIQYDNSYTRTVAEVWRTGKPTASRSRRPTWPVPRPWIFAQPTLRPRTLSAGAGWVAWSASSGTWWPWSRIFPGAIWSEQGVGRRYHETFRAGRPRYLVKRPEAGARARDEVGAPASGRLNATDQHYPAKKP